MTYATTSQATTYHTARLTAAAWSAVSAADKPLAIQSAADILDAYAAGHGGWRDDVTPAAVPQALTNACSELALTMTDPSALERITAQQQGVTSLSIGSASESYAGNAIGLDAALSPAIKALLRPYLKLAGGSVHIL